jgi:hypothetical protein
MEAYLQAKDLDVWRVTNEGMKNDTKKEKQFDMIAKSIILSSLDVGVFNRVFNCENAHELWKTINEQNKGSKEVANEHYDCLLKEFNSFKQLANKNVESMYSHLNVLVNDINALGVKNITDLNINRKILQSLRKPNYDLMKAIIYGKKLEELKPSHILSKIMAHELQIMPKSKKAPQEPSSPTTSDRGEAPDLSVSGDNFDLVGGDPHDPTMTSETRSANAITEPTPDGYRPCWRKISLITKINSRAQSKNEQESEASNLNTTRRWSSESQRTSRIFVCFGVAKAGCKTKLMLQKIHDSD